VGGGGGGAPKKRMSSPPAPAATGYCIHAGSRTCRQAEPRLGFRWRPAERGHPTGRERMGSSTLQTLPDPILLLPWSAFDDGGVVVGSARAAFQTQKAQKTANAPCSVRARRPRAAAATCPATCCRWIHPRPLRTRAPRRSSDARRGEKCPPPLAPHTPTRCSTRPPRRRTAWFRPRPPPRRHRRHRGAAQTAPASPAAAHPRPPPPPPT
jgi:hypothetical protein